MTEEQKNMQRKRDKRRRVAKMKTTIISFIVIWMVTSFIAIIGLTIKVVSLQRQINILSGKDPKSVQNTDSAVDNTSKEFLHAYGMAAEDNLANPEDTLKVYLTFDDGPSSNTGEILDILDDYGVKATFFVNGREDDNSKAMYQRIVDEGHTIGMHSYSHRYSDLYSSVDSFANDLDRIQNLIYDTTGVDSVYYRFPGGSSNKVSNVDMSEYIAYLNDQDITYFDWNVSSGDATSAAYTSDELVENVMSDVVKYKTSIVLMHDADSKDTTVEALPSLIENLQSVGAVILPISDETTLIQHVTVDSNGGQ